jgi:hypothetical protein
MTGERMTLDDFDAVLPRLGRLTLDTVKIARAVLVEGMGAAEAGHAHGMTRQRVHAIVKRFQAAAKEVPKHWRRIEVWLPPELAAEVEAMAEKARADYAGTEKGCSSLPA